MKDYLAIPTIEKTQSVLSEAQRPVFLRSLKTKSPTEWLRFTKDLRDSENVSEQSSYDAWKAPHCFHSMQSEHLKAIRRLGCRSFQKGQVAMLTVAGGLGTRLGFNGPKGLVPVTPIKKKTLFQVFAEKLKALQQIYGRPIHWLIMTSEETDSDTRKAFRENDWYDLNYVHFFKQGVAPAFTEDGLCVVRKDGSVHYYPDGHGGVFKALKRNGLLKSLKKWGIKYISYFQVDNPLVRLDDVQFLGFHIYKKSEFSTKVVEKILPEEKVGVFVNINKALRLVEYSEMPDVLTQQKNKGGRLAFRWGNTAIHLLNLDFIERCAKRDLPFHKAYKKIQNWRSGFDEEQVEVGIKWEQFIFDALPYARNPLLYEVERSEEFSPVKNAEGADSLETCVRDQVLRWRRWLEKVRKFIDIPEEFFNNSPVEISSLYADNLDVFIKKMKSLAPKREFFEKLYLE
ncbi:MAG: UTP--glucose-1-phosphate uridylyltransferase [bacterium]